MMSYKRPAGEHSRSMGKSTRLSPQIGHVSRSLADKMSVPSQRYSMTSTNSSGRRSSSSMDSSSKTTASRPSAIPRSTSATSQAKLLAIASSRSVPTYVAKSKSSLVPPLTAGMGASKDSRSELRPESSDRTRQPVRRYNDDQWPQRTPVSAYDSDKDSILGIALPQRQSESRQNNLPPQLIPELQALASSTRYPMLTSSSVSSISSPSTQFSNSPGPWSASTTTTSSTSWSTPSPCLMKPTRSPAYGNRSQTIPIPASSRTQMPSLPVLNESASISKPSSKQNLRLETQIPTERSRKKNSIGSSAPTPPRRSSSLKRVRSRSNSKTEDHRSQIPDFPAPPLPVEHQASPLARRGNHDINEARNGQSPEIRSPHNILQSAINSAPSRIDTSVGASRDLIHHVVHTSSTNTDDENSRRLLDAANIIPGRQSASETTPQSARSRLAKFSKMAFFGRAKDASESESKLQSRKLQRKGPAAGTGHEGYGRTGRKSKSASTDDSGAGTDSEGFLSDTSKMAPIPRARKESSTSSRRDRNSQSDLDDFAATRMKPVPIVGGSRRSISQHSDVLAMMRNASSDVGNPIEAPSSRAAHASTANMSATDSMIQQPWTSSTYSTSTDHSSFTQSHSQYGNTEAARLNRPSPSIPYVSSWNTSQSSVALSTIAPTDTSGDMYRVDSSKLEQQRKKARRSKWNIFRRRDGSVERHNSIHKPQEQSLDVGLSVEVSSNFIHRPQPYYAMMDAEHETLTPGALDQILKEAAHFLDADDEEEIDDFDVEEEKLSRQRVESILLPSAPQFQRSIAPSRPGIMTSPQHDLSTIPSVPSQSAQTLRRPRLAQVGRIPKVMPTTFTHRPDRRSFSRPFNQNLRSEFEQSASEPVSSGASAMSLSPDMQANLEAHQRVWGQGRSIAISPPPKMTDLPKVPTQALVDSLRLGDRQSITSSSSEGVISVMGPSLLPTEDFSGRNSRPIVGDEDIWKEYDDLIDHVASPVESQTLQLPVETKRLSPHKPSQLRLSSAGTDAPSLPALARGLAIDTSFSTTPIIYASPEVLEEADADQEFHLRRSRIISALHSSTNPSSPFSIADYFGDQKEKHNSGEASSTRLSGPIAVDRAPVSPICSGPAVALPMIPQDQTPNRTIRNEALPLRDAVNDLELSRASLEISRWLSFGRVLFSPAHLEIQKLPDKHVLAIDGLGSEDWSVYCAETYQAERAYVHDLKESSDTRHRVTQSEAKDLPPNFRRKQVTSFYEILKYPDNFFSVIVLRFPSIMADSKLKNMIAECRRVLAPGGYMELMVLDLDIVNMGVLTRRALRELKTKITISDPDVSLKPMIDNVQSVLGEKGFSKLSKFVVGVPVVGKPPSSAESPVSSRSSAGSEKQKFSHLAEPQPFDGILPSNISNFSLNDLVADHSDNADIKISKLVARTARSWWQQCFEAAVLPGGNFSQSILANRRILTECKNRACTFKMLIAYTQKPLKPALETKRRTMSEPTIATLATA